MIAPEAAINLWQTACLEQLARRFPAPSRISLRQDAPSSAALMLTRLADGSDLMVKATIHGWPDKSVAARRMSSLLTVLDTQCSLPAAWLGAVAFNDHRTVAGLAAARATGCDVPRSVRRREGQARHAAPHGSCNGAC